MSCSGQVPNLLNDCISNKIYSLNILICTKSLIELGNLLKIWILLEVYLTILFQNILHWKFLLKKTLQKCAKNAVWNRMWQRDILTLSHNLRSISVSAKWQWTLLLRSWLAKLSRRSRNFIRPDNCLLSSNDRRRRITVQKCQRHSVLSRMVMVMLTTLLLLLLLLLRSMMTVTPTCCWSTRRSKTNCRCRHWRTWSQRRHFACQRYNVWWNVRPRCRDVSPIWRWTVTSGSAPTPDPRIALLQKKCSSATSWKAAASWKVASPWSVNIPTKKIQFRSGPTDFWVGSRLGTK